MQTLLLLCLLAVFVPRSEAVAADEPTFIDIRNQCVGTQCARGQWAVNIALGDSTRPGQWTRMYPGNATHPLGTCSTPKYDACFNETSPLGMPIKVRETAQMQVTFQWRNQFNRMVLFNKTNMQPQRMEFKLCYSNVAFLNRAWRRKNKPYPRLSQNCPFHVRDVEINRTMNPLALTQADKNAMSGTFVYDFNDDTMPTGTLYLMMWLRCTDSKVCGWESMESPFYAVPQEGILVYPPDYSSAYPAPFNVPGPYNGTYIQTEVYNGITPGMTAAAIVLSIFGPVFFIVYFIADHISYTKTGKALAW